MQSIINSAGLLALIFGLTQGFACKSWAGGPFDAKGLSSPTQTRSNDHELTVEDILPHMGAADLSPDEFALLEQSLREFNGSSLHVSLHREHSSSHRRYFCVGAKGAIVVLGLQGLKCINSSNEMIFIGSKSGIIDPNSFGLDIGLSLLVGFADLYCDPVQCEGEYNRVSIPEEGDILSGGTINGAYGFMGASIGYYESAQRSVALGLYQAGFAFEINRSGILIVRMN